MKIIQHTNTKGLITVITLEETILIIRIFLFLFIEPLDFLVFSEAIKLVKLKSK